MKWRPCTKPILWELNSFLTVCTKHFLLFQYFVELLATWVKTLYSLLFACLLACQLPSCHLLTLLLTFVPFSNDSNVTDQDGNTPLHLAAISSKTECMRVLLRAGATDSLSLGMLIVHDNSFLPLLPSQFLSERVSSMLTRLCEATVSPRSSARMLLSESDVASSDVTVSSRH